MQTSLSCIACNSCSRIPSLIGSVWIQVYLWRPSETQRWKDYISENSTSSFLSTCKSMRPSAAHKTALQGFTTFRCFDTTKAWSGKRLVTWMVLDVHMMVGLSSRQTLPCAGLPSHRPVTSSAASMGGSGWTTYFSGLDSLGKPFQAISCRQRSFARLIQSATQF